MNTKLTLSLNKDIIEQAKAYAKAHNISLSFVIENYLQKVTTEYTDKSQSKGSIVEALSGIIHLDAEENYKNEFTNYLTEKYK